MAGGKYMGFGLRKDNRTNKIIFPILLRVWAWILIYSKRAKKNAIKNRFCLYVEGWRQN